MRKILSCFLLAAAYSITLFAQSAPAGSGQPARLWAGAEFSDFNPDYGCANNLPFSCAHDLLGIGAVAEYGLWSRFALEGQTQWLVWNGPSGMKESSYLAGPIFRLWSHGKWTISPRFLVGGAMLSLPQGTSGYFAYAPGAKVSYFLTSRARVFASYDYQRWPSFNGAAASGASQTGSQAHGLTPNGLSFGAEFLVF